MKITLKVQFLDESDKSDSVVVVSDMLAAWHNNKNSDSISLSISRWSPPYQPQYDNNSTGYRYTGKKFNADQ